MSSDEELLKCVVDCFAPAAKSLGCSSTDLNCLCTKGVDPSEGIDFGLCFANKCGLSSYSRLQEICAKETGGSGSSKTSSAQSSSTPNATQQSTPNATQQSTNPTADGTSPATSKQSDSSKSSDSANTGSSQAGSSSSSSGLSAGAAAGIGVGAALAVMLVLIGLFLLWRKKRKQRKANAELSPVDDKPELSGKPVYKAEVQGDEYRSELHGQYTHTPVSGTPDNNQAKELQGSHAVYELPVESQNR